MLQTKQSCLQVAPLENIYKKRNYHLILKILPLISDQMLTVLVHTQVNYLVTSPISR